MKSLFSAAIVAASFAAALPSAALADGPCSDQIATVGRQLASQPGLGAPISEPAAGPTSASAAASAGPVAKPGDRAQPGGASLTGGGSAGTVGGVAGAAGASAGARDAVASGEVATSPEDVRRQSVGKPTTAQEAASAAGHGGAPAVDMTRENKASEAKMALQQAVDLNAKGDSSCMKALDKARSLMSKG